MSPRNTLGGIFPWILITGLLFGLIYIVVIPPWQHSDEPTHFEYSWLLANRSPNPSWEIEKYLIRRDLAASMIENGFFEDLEFQSDLQGPPESIWIGQSQLSDPPLYYGLTGYILRWLDFIDIEVQLYLLRAESVLLFLGVLFLTFLFIKEFYPGDHPLLWVAPGVIVLVPAFVNLMTSVNNDVGAIFAFSVYLYLGVRLILRGFSPNRIIVFLVAGAICILTKNTTWSVIPLTLIILVIIPIYSKLSNKVLFFLLSAVAIGIMVSLLSFGDSSIWYRAGKYRITQSATQIIDDAAIFGRSVISIEAKPDGERSLQVFQPIPLEDLTELQNGDATLAGWMWADQPLEIRTPVLWIDGKPHFKIIPVDEHPKFWAFSARVPEASRQIQINIDPNLKLTGSPWEPVSIYYDGLILTPGMKDDDNPPIFSDPNLHGGIWGEEEFINLVRNPSFERKWITIRPAINQFINSRSPVNPSLILVALQDPLTLGWLFKPILTILFQSFWARFGWNHIRLVSVWYWAIAAWTAIGTFAGIAWLFKNKNTQFPRKKIAVAWLAIAVVLTWTSAFFRVNLPFWGANALLPAARYAYPVIIPTVLFLSSGWLYIINKLKSPIFGYLLIFIPLVLLSLASIYVIINFYN